MANEQPREPSINDDQAVMEDMIARWKQHLIDQMKVIAALTKERDELKAERDELKAERDELKAKYVADIAQ